MLKERHKAVPAVYLVLKRADKVLMMRRANTGYMDGQYGLCAGHVEAGELPIAALCREAAEEIGITIDPQELKLIHTMYRTAKDETGDRVDLFFEATSWSGEPENKEPKKCDDVNWFKVTALPETCIPYIKNVLAGLEREVSYSELE